MFSIFKKKAAALLSVQANGRELCRISQSDLPCEIKPCVWLEADSILEFVDSTVDVHRHELGATSGWFHFSIRVHANLGCQADCVISQTEQLDPDAFATGKAAGIRFQPFFLPGAAISNAALAGKGLFARGLHFSGLVTNSNVLLSCECEHCKRSFLIRSYHAGFSEAGLLLFRVRQLHHHGRQPFARQPRGVVRARCPGACCAGTGTALGAGRVPLRLPQPVSLPALFRALHRL
ncbi:hypothetical protein [Xanthomonas cannabis]|uniref:Uncharacterized protein n=1 Tax=Xanthomonas cannabis TaxID=1885674 RepID=A0ABR6JLY5_9XANT|nr:hypothetical protein [Xanthomonas cannabis]MBB4593825.1 hypothetical protein [Xanthomonas cannabis]MBB5522397.1 hypothetical protein [Xanthomonas cannabis]